MCASALNLVHFGKIYFGCYNERFGGCGPLHLHKSRYVCRDLIDFVSFHSNTHSALPSKSHRGLDITRGF